MAKETGIKKLDKAIRRRVVDTSKVKTRFKRRRGDGVVVNTRTGTVSRIIPPPRRGKKKR